MKLYGDVRSPDTRKIRLLLAEKRRHAEFVAVDCLSGEHKRAAHRLRHPFGELPVLEEDDGFCLYEMGAILRYLDDGPHGAPLTPAGPRARARMEQWLGVEQTYLKPALQTLHYQLLLRGDFGEWPDEVEVKRALGEARQTLDVLSRALGEGASEFLAGEAFSLADLSFMPSYQFLLDFAPSALAPRRPALERWWQRVSARSSYAALLAPGSSLGSHAAAQHPVPVHLR